MKNREEGRRGGRIRPPFLPFSLLFIGRASMGGTRRFKNVTV
jgi:hypothetical protein